MAEIVPSFVRLTVAVDPAPFVADADCWTPVAEAEAKALAVAAEAYALATAKAWMTPLLLLVREAVAVCASEAL